MAVIIAAVLLTVFNNFSVKPEPQEMSYSSFVAEVQQDQVSDVAIDGLVIVGKTKQQKSPACESSVNFESSRLVA